MASFGCTDEEFDPGAKLPVLNPGCVLFISSGTLSELFSIFSYSVKGNFKLSSVSSLNIEMIIVPTSWIIPKIK